MSWKNVTKDTLAGLTTSFAAIALGAAFGIQSGRGALSGMLAAAIIPIITSILGGTRIQASGPTAPMTAVAVLIVGYAHAQFTGSEVEQFITLVMLMSGIITILGGLLRLGKLISWVPQVVTLGFMNGIAVLIWWDQIKKLFGLGGTIRLTGDLWYNLAFALVTFVGILLFPTILKFLKVPKKYQPFIPGSLVIIISLTYVFIFSRLQLQTVALGNSIGSIGEFTDLVKNLFPTSILTTENLLKALPFALQLSLLGYLDSLLTSLVIDTMTNEKTKRNKELVAQGLANSAAALVGGIPGAQATIRSVLLIKEGAQTRLAGVLVGIFAFLGIFVFKDMISLVATSIFVGVLFKAGLDVFEKDYLKDFVSQKRYLDREHMIQFAFVLYTTLVTVFWDLNVAVISATILFYLGKRFWDVKDITEVEQKEDLVGEM